MKLNNLYYLGILSMLAIAFLYYFRFESNFIQTLCNYSSVLLLLIGGFLAVTWYIAKRPVNIGPTLRQIDRFWAFVVIWMLFVPLIFFQSTNNTFYEGMHSDYRYILFSILPFMIVTNNSINYYRKIWKYVGIFAIFGGCISFFLADKFIALKSERNTQGLAYYLWTAVVCAYPYLFLRSVLMKYDVKGIILFLLNITLSLIFLKRTGVVSASYFIISIILFGALGKKFRTGLFSIFLIFGACSIFLYLGYFGAITGRFQKDADDIENFDRVLEINEYFDAATFSNIITGYGINNYLIMKYVGIEDGSVRALHIGALNIVYKGGFLYVCFYLFFIWQVFSLWKYRNLDPEILIGFLIGVYSIFALSFEGSWSYVPYHFFRLLPIYRAIYLKDNFKKRIG